MPKVRHDLMQIADIERLTADRTVLDVVLCAPDGGSNDATEAFPPVSYHLELPRPLHGTWRRNANDGFGVAVDAKKMAGRAK